MIRVLLGHLCGQPSIRNLGHLFGHHSEVNRDLLPDCSMIAGEKIMRWTSVCKPFIPHRTSLCERIGQPRVSASDSQGSAHRTASGQPLDIFSSSHNSTCVARPWILIEHVFNVRICQGFICSVICPQVFHFVTGFFPICCLQVVYMVSTSCLQFLCALSIQCRV